MKYRDKFHLTPHVTRALVSFQANREAPFYRWYKYREAFSYHLVQQLLDEFKPNNTPHPTVLDPFAGAGTTLTAATKAGWHATGIELLPIGTAAMNARLKADTVDLSAFRAELTRLRAQGFQAPADHPYRFSHIRITKHAFPPANEEALSRYMAFVSTIADHDVRYLFWFAALSILEDISYTRKDGQYLRWDVRSGKPLKSAFCKGDIPQFQAAIWNKLNIMCEDLACRNGATFSGHAQVIQGSTLEHMPNLPSSSFDLIITSPPYCNRYDYTRTYALELAFLGYDELAVRRLRQTLISATVENKTKRTLLEALYSRKDRIVSFQLVEAAFAQQAALHEVLALLESARQRNSLNNPNIPTMVHNYFYELSFTIFEMARVLKPGGYVIMVNDNVQYHGEEIPVDLILSNLAEQFGLEVVSIWVLPRGKGNSSQQMGLHGRKELRKCIYIWRKPN